MLLRAIEKLALIKFYGGNFMDVSLVIKEQLKKILNDSQQKVLKRFYLRLYSFLYKNNLSKLAIAFGTDKEGEHHYTKHYQHHFKSQQRKNLNVLEIGIGGYDNPRDGGQSLKMWKAYFPKSHIFGVDIYDKAYHDEYRIKTFKGSQVDEDFLKRVTAEIGTIDIIIDDGSHYNEHVITTFKMLFPLLSENGIYVIEDLQTSYLDDEMWGGSRDLNAPHTSMNFLKSLTDGLNHYVFKQDGYTPTYYDKHIISIHFYQKLVFIYKGLNTE